MAEKPTYEKLEQRVKELEQHVKKHAGAEEEKKNLEMQLQQAQKMEVIGTLAGGIAHDFNNILSAIIGYSELALREVPEETKLYTYIQGVRKAGKRARNLVSQILSFSRRSEEEREPIQITPILKEGLKLLRASLPTTIEIRQNLGSQLGNVIADPTQVHQVIMNLCTNAAHAMREKGGVLEVNLESVDLDTFFVTQHPDIVSGKYLKLTVSDTGCGMTMDVMEKIFDPYFTTKQKGVGTGLGLAVIQGIIKSHGGTITVESNPDMGSTFTIFLPVIDEKESLSITSTFTFLPMGTERILYIDDEHDLVDIVTEMLESLAYEVVGTTSSLKALELFSANPGKFDLVITDMAMPKMTEEEAKALGIREFVMKPIFKDKLALTITQVLHGKKKGN